jgi:glycosyltransferase involved in cell wall biosynthesis
MKICWFGIYNKDYSRNNILIAGLKENGVEIIECHENWNERFRYFKLIKKLLALKNNYDVVYAAFPAQISTIIAKIFSSKKVVMDAFFSMYDAMVYDRREISWWRPRALKFLFLDWLSAFLADMVITDTNSHCDFWAGWRFINKNKIKVVYLGINDSLVFPQKISSPYQDKFLVQFYGNYIPLHGAMKIVQAAEILKNDQSIKFRIIGKGQEREKVEQFIKTKKLDIDLVDRVQYSELVKLINQTDVALGIFGNTPKSDRVIPNKVYEGMAAKKPVITKDSPAIRELFSEKELMIIENTPEVLARAILELKNNEQLREEIAQNGYIKIKKDLTQKSVARTLIKYINLL